MMRRVLVTGSGTGLHAAAAVLLVSGYGVSILPDLPGLPERDSNVANQDLLDRLDVLDLLLGSPDVCQRGEAYNPAPSVVTFIDKPKSIGKRKARRLKARKAAALVRAHD